MNQTQKKFVIEQAFSLIKGKISDTVKESEAIGVERRKFCNDPEAMKKAIEKGTVKLRDKPTSMYLEGLYDTTKYVKSRDKAADKKFGTAVVTKTLLLPNPYIKDAYMRNVVSAHSSIFPTQLARIKDLISKMDSFIEEVIIGDSETARRMLKDLQEL